jgi:2-C-methyl-D-erythritol 4-phosphate cytidylyltransferase
VTAIVASAGSGRRLGLGTKKPFVRLAGIPIIVRTVRSVSASDAVDSVVVAVEPSCVGRFRALAARYSLSKVAAVIAGGRTRAESVRNCLARIGDSCEIVLIHDGCRPFVDKDTISAAVAAARRYGACIAAVPESDTVKVAGRGLAIERTLDRRRIFRAQTPQAFRRRVITRAYERAPSHVTDDAGAVERAGGKVKIVPGSYRNIKITTKEDLAFARALLS